MNNQYQHQRLLRRLSGDFGMGYRLVLIREHVNLRNAIRNAPVFQGHKGVYVNDETGLFMIQASRTIETSALRATVESLGLTFVGCAFWGEQAVFFSIPQGSEYEVSK